MQNLVSFKVSTPKSRFTNNHTQTIVEINVKGFTHTVYIPAYVPFIEERLNYTYNQSLLNGIKPVVSSISENNAETLLAQWTKNNDSFKEFRKLWTKVQDLICVLKEFNMDKVYKDFDFYQEAYNPTLNQPYLITELDNGQGFYVMQKETAERVWEKGIEEVAENPTQENFMYDVTDVGMWFGAEEYTLVRDWYIFIK